MGHGLAGAAFPIVALQIMQVVNIFIRILLQVEDSLFVLVVFLFFWKSRLFKF